MLQRLLQHLRGQHHAERHPGICELLLQQSVLRMEAVKVDRNVLEPGCVERDSMHPRGMYLSAVVDDRHDIESTRARATASSGFSLPLKLPLKGLLLVHDVSPATLPDPFYPRALPALFCNVRMASAATAWS